MRLLQRLFGRQSRSQPKHQALAPFVEDQRLRLVLDEALRSNAQQQRVLDELRSRTGTLLSAIAISTAFIGAQALSNGGLGLTGWGAIVSFVAAEIMCLVILVPKRHWKFRFEVRALLRDYVDETPVNIDDMRAILAGHLEDNYRDNQVSLDALFVAYRAAAAFLMIEVLLWLLELGGS